MPIQHVRSFLSAALALRVHLIALFALAYLIFCRALDGRISFTEAFCGAGFVVLLLAGYAANRLHDREEDLFNGDTLSLPGSPAAWRTGIPLAFAATAGAMLLAAPVLWPVLLYSSVIAFAYGHPAVRLKRRSFLKPLVNTLNFFAVAVASPFALHDPGAWAYLHMQAAGAWRLLGLVLCMTVFLDVRDAEGDARAGIRTLPVILGAKSVLIAIVCFALVSAALGLGEDGAGGTLAQLAMAGFALGAIRGGRPRGYYDLLILTLAAALSFLFRI